MNLHSLAPDGTVTSVNIGSFNLESYPEDYFHKNQQGWRCFLLLIIQMISFVDMHSQEYPQTAKLKLHLMEESLFSQKQGKKT